MAVSNYWVGDIPSAPLTIRVRDSRGNPLNLLGYTFEVNLLGSDNEEIDASGGVLQTAGAVDGRLVFRWPTDESLFDKPGEYLLQLELNGPSGTKDSTTAHTIRVRKLGGV